MFLVVVTHFAVSTILWTILGFEGEGSNCFSITQLVGQKKAIISSAKKKYLFGNETK